jgi:hypothetical protein
MTDHNRRRSARHARHVMLRHPNALPRMAARCSGEGTELRRRRGVQVSERTGEGRSRVSRVPLDRARERRSRSTRQPGRPSPIRF